MAVGCGVMTTWEERLAAELDDLEQQAEGLHLADRDVEVAEQGPGAYAAIELVDRIHASVGAPLHLVTLGGSLEGVLVGAGRDWLLLRHARGESVVLFHAVLRARGLSAGAVPEVARGVLTRRGLGSVLRRLAEEADEVRLTAVDGSAVQGRLRRVGADFVEVAGASGAVDVVAVGRLAVLRRLGG